MASRREAWALERAANPTVLRLHTTAELTGKAIETCPPAFTSRPLCQLPEMRACGPLLHCYLARLNLTPDADPDSSRRRRVARSETHGVRRSHSRRRKPPAASGGARWWAASRGEPGDGWRPARA